MLDVSSGGERNVFEFVLLKEHGLGVGGYG